MTKSGDVPFTPKREEPVTFRARVVTPSLTVRDIQKSIVWYRDIAAFMVHETWDRDGTITGATLKAGEVELWLSQDDGSKGRDRVKGEGFSLTFTTVQDVVLFANEIKSRGGVLETEPQDMPWGVKMFSMRDPDGFKICFAREL
jgi:uncharacterized glyoxalase superfamily protein PhnB